MSIRFNSVLTTPQSFVKHPDEEWTDDAQKQMDFSLALPTGATLASVDEIEAVAVGTEDTTTGAVMVADNGSISGDNVLYDVIGGYDGNTYAIKITVNLTGGGKLTGIQQVICSIGYCT